MNNLNNLTALGSGLSSLAQHPDMQAPHQQAGSLLGNDVELASSEVNTLGDAAEELSLHMAEKTENKHHAERRVRPDKPMGLLQANEIVQMLQQARDPDAQAKLDELVSRLMAGGHAPRREAARAFGEPSQQYLALQYALHQAKEQGASDALIESLQDAIAELEIDQGPQIRAGLNSLNAASEFANDRLGVERFQGTYRDLVLGEASLSKTLGLVSERLGANNLAAAMTQLISALGHDLAASRPSTDPERLRALASDLHQLQTAVTILNGCQELATQLRARGASRIDAEALLRELISLTNEKWPTEKRFDTIATQHIGPDPGLRREFIGAVRDILRELPTQVFPDMDARQALLTAAQDALDIAIDQEFSQ